MRETTHPVRCRCGSLKGIVTVPRTSSRVICYCKDCQAFARFLGAPDSILDRDGGTDTIQISQMDVTFTEGVEHLACVRLMPKGLNRWYARCCRTPIGNTGRNKNPAAVWMVHSCMDGQPLEASFGPVKCRVSSKSSTTPGRKDNGVVSVVFSFLAIAAVAFVTKSASAFFSRDGSPVSAPEILPADALEKLRDGH